MTTNPLGKGKVNLSVNMPRSMRAQLELRAKKSGLKLGEYCRAILEDALNRRIRILTRREIIAVDEDDPTTKRVAEDKSGVR